jgi:hypothetical protein
MKDSKPPFTCGVTGRSYPVHEVAERVDLLARSLRERISCAVNEGSELDKVVCVYSVNTVITLPNATLHILSYMKRYVVLTKGAFIL